MQFWIIFCMFICLIKLFLILLNWFKTFVFSKNVLHFFCDCLPVLLLQDTGWPLLSNNICRNPFLSQNSLYKKMQVLRRPPQPPPHQVLGILFSRHAHSGLLLSIKKDVLFVQQLHKALLVLFFLPYTLNFVVLRSDCCHILKSWK